MKLGHAHLKVRELKISERFYTSLLGLKVTERLGEDFLFLSFGAAHHDLALQSVGRTAPNSPAGAVGLYHVAFEVSEAKALLTAIEKLGELGAEAALVDHGISWAIYTRDPDGNGIEIFLDRRQMADGSSSWNGRSSSLEKEQILLELNCSFGG